MNSKSRRYAIRACNINLTLACTLLAYFIFDTNHLSFNGHNISFNLMVVAAFWFLIRTLDQW